VPDAAAVFFDDSILQEIRLSINTRDWTSLKVHFTENTYYPADMRWNNQVVRNIGIRSRGTGSRSGVKPGLRVDFDRFTSGQRFVGLKSFILRNQTQDPSGVRERVSMAFFRRMGLVAEREAHVKLYVNNEYVGLFTIVESPDKDFVQKNFAENEGWIYEFHFDNAAVAAGAKPFVFQYLGPSAELYVPVPFKPETHEDDPQGEVIAHWIQAINDTNAASWRTSMAQYLDLGKFVRHIAIENFLADQDGMAGDFAPNNFYLYRFINTTRFMFLPWDKSNALWDPNFSIFRNLDDGPEDHRNRLILRVLQEPDLRQLYLDTLLECAASADEGSAPATDATPASPGWFESEVLREYAQIHAAALEDQLIFSNQDFAAAIQDVTRFARERRAAVRQQVAAKR
jgi:spore coat protein CotH